MARKVSPAPPAASANGKQTPATPSRRSSRPSAAPQSTTNGKPASSRQKPTSTASSASTKRKAADTDDVEIAETPKKRRGSVSAGAGSRAVVKNRKVGINPVPLPPLPSNPPRTLFIFGSGDMGAMGLGTDELGEIPRPRLHKWFEEGIAEGRFGAKGRGIEGAYAGGMHTLVVDESGKVWSWGVNDNACLGRITANVPDPENPGEVIEAEVLETQPMVVQGLVDEEFRTVQICAGDSISIALSEDGDVRAWGSFRSSEGLLGFNGVPGASKTQFSPIPLPSISNHRFSAVACGADHVLALTTDGFVYVWGNGDQNQLGRRIIERRKINGLAPERLALRNIVAIGAGAYHSFAVNKDGKVYAWGLNSLRQTGVSEDRGGEDDIIQVPTLVDGLDPSEHGGAKVIQIEGGEHHTIFLFDNGEVWGCGRCDGFQLGLGKEHPARKECDERIQLAKEEVLAQRQKDGTTEGPIVVDEFIPEPVQIFFPPPPTADKPAPELSPYPKSAAEYAARPMVHISAGPRHNLAVSKDGCAYSWGYGNQCQLGLGPDTEEAEVPTRVRSKALNDFKVLTASAGGAHCVFVAQRKTEEA